MKAKSIISAVLTLFLLTGFALADNSGPTWYTNWDKAAAAAKKENKPILMDFTGSDWCGWCIKLHDEVFSKDEFKSWASKKRSRWRSRSARTATAVVASDGCTNR